MENKNIVEYVANLARIDISDEEKDLLGEQLLKIINYIDKLKELNVENIEPLGGVHCGSNVFRDDKVTHFSFKKEILRNAPLKEGDYFKIPKVIE